MTTKIEKNTANDKRNAIESAVKESVDSSWLADYDDNFAYYEVWEGENAGTYKIGYTITDELTVTLDNDPTEVVRTTAYKDVVKSDEPVTKSYLSNWLDKHFGGSRKKAQLLLKQFSDDDMIEIAPVYIAPYPLEIDAHGDTITLEETISMVANINKNIENGNLQANFDHEETTDKFHFIKAWVAECDCTIGDSYVPEGQPLIKVQYTDEDLWKERKAGERTGWSIGARASSFSYKDVEVATLDIEDVL